MTYGPKDWLIRLQSLERTLAKLYRLRPYVPGNDATVPGTQAWIAERIARTSADYAHVTTVLNSIGDKAA